MSEENSTLTNSRPIDVHRWSDYPQVKGLVDKIYLETLDIDERKRVRNRKSLRMTVGVFVLDLYLAWRADPQLFVSVHKTPKAYVGSESRYKRIHLKYANVIIVINALKKLGYLIEHIGTYNRDTAYGCLTRIRATSQLIGLIENERILLPMLSNQPKTECIVVKKDKQYVEYEDTPATHEMRDKLNVINNAYAETNIDIRLTNEQHLALNQHMRGDPNKAGVDLTRKYLHRSFIDTNFSNGGRFYGPFWQGIPKEYRKYIVIDGKATVEIDYSAIHFRIMYALEGHPLGADEDPYTLNGFMGEAGRKVIKQASNVLLNSSSLESARRAIASNVITTAELPEQYSSLSSFISALISRHEPIKHKLLTGAGVYYQYLDSVIAENVILTMLSYGYVVLPVHDSFIVRQSRSGLLKDTMEVVFQHIVGAITTTDSKQLAAIRNNTKIERLLSNLEQEAIMVKAEVDLDSGEYQLYQRRQAEWYELHPMTYSPDMTSKL